MATKVIMPKLGESVVEGTVSRWLVQEGDSIKEFDPILEVSTDKVETDIPSPAAGVVLKIIVAEDATVTAGTVLAWIGQPGEEIPGEEQPQTASYEPAMTKMEPASAPQKAAPAARDLGFISPVVAKMAAEYKLDLQQIRGTGGKGRITKQDVLAYLAQKPAAAPEPAAWETPGEGDLFRPTEMLVPGSQTAQQVQPGNEMPTGGQLIPHTRMRSMIAEHMVNSKHISAHVTTVMEADMQAVTKDRERQKADFERQGVHLTYTAYFMQAVVQALKAHPMANASWREDGLYLHEQVNLGMAVSLGSEGLLVPVIRQAENYSLLGLARVLQDLAQRARSKQLTADELQGGTFTITNHGGGRSLFATPIINQPQVGILGVGMIQKRAVVIEDAIAIRPMVYLSFSFDHRVLDGAAADAFLATVVDRLEGWRS